MGTPHAPSVSAGSPQGYAFSNTSQQHIEAIFQEMATLSAQPGPFPKQCLWCWILIHGHAHAMHGHADSLSADQQLVLSEQQQLHNQHHHEPKLTTEQTRTPLDDPQQQVHNEHQEQLVLHERTEQQVHNEHQEQLVHNKRKEQQVYNEHDQQLVHHEQQQQHILHEREERCFHNEHEQQLVLNQQQQQHILHEQKERSVHNEHEQQLVLDQQQQQHVLHERKERSVHNEHEQQLVLNQQQQQHVLHEQKERSVHNEHEQQLVLDQQQQQHVLHERKERSVHNEHEQQLVLNQQQQQHVLHEQKERSVHDEHEQQLVLNQQQQQHVLHEQKERSVHNEHEQQLVLNQQQQQVLHERKEQQDLLNEHKDQQALNDHKQQHDDQESQRIRREGQYGQSSPDMKDAISETPQIEVLKKIMQRPLGTGVTGKPPVNHGGTSALENSVTATTFHGVYDHDVHNHHDSLTTEKVHDLSKWEMKKVELMKKVTDMKTSSHSLGLELKQTRDAESQLRAQLQESNTKHHSTVKNYDSGISSLTTRNAEYETRMAKFETRIAEYETRIAEYETRIAEYETRIVEFETRIAEYKAIADNLTKQLSNAEFMIAKLVGGAGAHKDSHATPPNLVKCREVVDQAIITFTKAFTAYLKERSAFESHVAVISVPDERGRKYAMRAYICSRLFAGFENDCYTDSLDCVRSSKYLPAKYEETQIFLRNQNPELRNKQYVAEYERTYALGVKGIMETLKNLDTFKELEKDANAPFFQFCCRKIVSIMSDVDKFVKEFPPSRDYSQRFLLKQLATNSAYCDKVLKPFVKLAMAAFLLHRLAFQFQPPARIFRYASGAPFDATYMEHAVPIDHGESDKDFVVGVMLLPGFQVGATIIKCGVTSVP